jgi:hypothetical protein
MLKSAALIRNGAVVNVAAYDEDTSGPWLDGVRTDYDEVRIVDAAGIGWTVEADGLRPPSPFPSWTWDGEAWVAPVPAPDGANSWDEDAQAWVTVD